MFWNNFPFNFCSLYFFPVTKLEEKLIMGKKHAFLVWSYAKFQSRAKFYGHVNP